MIFANGIDLLNDMQTNEKFKIVIGNLLKKKLFSVQF